VIATAPRPAALKRHFCRLDRPKTHVQLGDQRARTTAATRPRGHRFVNFAGFFPDGTALAVVRLPDPAAAVATPHHGPAAGTARAWTRPPLEAQTL